MTPEDMMQNMMAEAQAALEREQAETELMQGETAEQAPEPIDAETLRSYVQTELEQARTAYTDIEGDREDALRYYVGKRPLPAEPDRSAVVSTDVADAIEWMMPQIMDALIAKGAVVQFDALGPQDEDQAGLETDFTHFTFMQENEGYLTLYTMVKDALMMKNGVIKVWYEEKPETKSESYDGVTMQELMMLQQDPTIEVVEVQSTQIIDMQTQQPVELNSVRLERTCMRGKVRVEAVPPEELFVAAGHDSACLDDCRFVAQTPTRTASDLIKEGYDPDVIMNAPSYQDTESEYRFNAQDETQLTNYASSEDPSQKLIQIIEAYMQVDVEGRGVSALHKVTCIGDQYTVSDILDVEPVSEIPFVSAAAWLMPHKYYALSVYDRLKEIQDGKTSLWRNTLDNIYIQNNREKEVLEGRVNLDDLLLSRPGGIKRVKQMGAIRELEVQPVGADAQNMMAYFDNVRAGRVGVSPDMSGQALPIGQDTAHGVERVMTAAEALVGLVVRTIAETGLRPAYKKVRDLLVRYQDSTTAFKFRDQWVGVNPTEWGERSRMTVTVGTGTGDDMRRQAALQRVLEYQTMLVQDPRNTMVDQPQIYNALDDLADAAGLNGADRYFLNPTSPQGEQKQLEHQQEQQQATEREEALQEGLAEAQQKLASAEQAKGMAQMQNAEVRAQKAMADVQIEQLKLRIQTLEEEGSRRYDYDKLASDTAIKLTELEAEHQRDLSAQHQENVETATDG